MRLLFLLPGFVFFTLTAFRAEDIIQEVNVSTRRIMLKKRNGGL
jgi:hypothetical protein